MAVTLAAPPETAQDLLYFSIPITKWETDADGDLIIKGVATDGTVDSDDQIVDPVWSAKALTDWLATGGNVRQSHDAHRPIGKGLKVEINKDGTDKHWLTAVIVDTDAQKLIKKGVLQAYSVGISRPVIKHDPRVRNGRICGGEFAEVSVVDRPSNKSSYLEIAKSAGGTCEYVQELHASDEIIAKFASEDLLVKQGNGVHDDLVPFAEDMSLTFTPNDLAKILKSKIIDQHYDELALKALYEAEEAVYKRSVSTAERRSLAGEGNALSDGSYPIANAGDLHNAAHLASTGHGNVEGAKRLIARRAKELGVANPLTENHDSEDSGKGTTSVVDETTAPDLVKDNETAPEAVKDLDAAMMKDDMGMDMGMMKADGDDDAVEDAASGEEKAKKPKGKKMPPWLNKPSDDDSSSGDDDSCKMDHVHSEKCSGTPQSASGAGDAASMQEIPNTGPALETPAPAGIKTPDLKTVGGSPETAALMRFKAIGIDTDLGKLHDLTCAAYHPDEVAKYHPYADLSSVIDVDVWQRKAVDAACGPIEKAMELTKAWSAAQTLKSADLAELNDYRLEMHKAFRDANPGPTSYPSPGSISPNGYNRPVITAGHAANSPGYDGPNSTPDVASGPPNASHFDRPPLGAGQQSPSPSFMKGGGAEYPDAQGVPTRIDYAHVEKEKARQALSLIHDNLSRMFPPLCPMMPNVAQPESRPIPPAAGLGKQVEPAETSAAVSKSLPEISPEIVKEIEKGMKKKLGKKVLAGKMTVDEARAKLGRKVTQKALEAQVQAQLEKGEITRDEALKALGFEVETPAAPPIEKAASVTPVAETISPDIIKSAIADAIAPLVEQINKQQATITEQEARWESMANAADPRTTSWAGLAVKSAQPVAVTKQAEIAEHTQQMINRQLSHIWRTSENPYEREAARNELDKRGGIAE